MPAQARFVPWAGEARAAAGSLPPQPTYVRRLVQGEVTNAWPHAEDPFAGRRTSRNAQQRAGKAYEARVAQFLFGSSWDGTILHSPWFAYTDGSGDRGYCQPDFILDRGHEAIVVEAKLRWHPDAWWQLERLYLPVLRVGFPGRELRSLCICGSYDRSIEAPGPVVVVSNLSEAKAGQFSVMVVR